MDEKGEWGRAEMAEMMRGPADESRERAASEGTRKNVQATQMERRRRNSGRRESRTVQGEPGSERERNDAK